MPPTGHVRLEAIPGIARVAVKVACVVDVAHNGETIAEYPDDQPYPSRLLLGFASGRALHVVVGFDAVAGECYVITAYDPDPDLWDERFTQRRT